MLHTADAIKWIQGLFHGLEKTQAPEDWEYFMGYLAQYEQAVNAAIATLDESGGSDRAYARDLAVAQEILQRQLQQLGRFQASVRPDRPRS